jgi:hypothetical protein
LENFLPFVLAQILIHQELINYHFNCYNLVLNQESNFHYNKSLILTLLELEEVLVEEFDEEKTLIYYEFHQQIKKAKMHLLAQYVHTLSFLDRLLLFE